MEHEQIAKSPQFISKDRTGTMAGEVRESTDKHNSRILECQIERLSFRSRELGRRNLYNIVRDCPFAPSIQARNDKT